MESFTLPAILIGIILIAGVSKHVRGTMITLPMLYTLFGLLVALLFSDCIDISYDNPLVEAIATVTLILVLSTDASRISVRNVIKFHDLPLRLLAIGLPLTIALGAVLAALFFPALGIWEAAILAVILAPTDASLGQSVVDNKKVPQRIRQGLNIESGLNDGIAMPFLVFFIALAVSPSKDIGDGSSLIFMVSQIGLGILVGSALGYVCAKYLLWGQKSDWMSGNFQKLAALGLVLLTYLIAEWLGGNGYIASFCFGIASGNALGQNRSLSIYRFGKVEYTLLMLLTYAIFGMAMLMPALQKMTPTIMVYVLLSLTIVRMAPVALSYLMLIY